MAITLLHLSDLHFGAKDLNLGQVISQGVDKGLLGFYNLKLNPSRRFSPKTRKAALDKALQLPWDQLAFTGDLTSLSLDSEFTNAKEALAPFLQKPNPLIIPGNHDCYTANATYDQRLEKAFGEYLPTFDQAIASIALDDQWQAILVNQAEPNAFYDSRGWFEEDALRLALEQARDKRIVVMGHYAACLPQGIKEAKMHKLRNVEVFEQILKDAGAELYLHGHIHKSWAHRPYSSHKLQTVCSGGTARHAKGAWAGFHLITLGDEVNIQRVRA
ncbi:MAG: metallophosphoesterase [SAR324 cluster bacterium]|nr:metallophosphoesterase [SAR324 cluster bacterium]